MVRPFRSQTQLLRSPVCRDAAGGMLSSCQLHSASNSAFSDSLTLTWTQHSAHENFTDRQESGRRVLSVGRRLSGQLLECWYDWCRFCAARYAHVKSPKGNVNVRLSTKKNLAFKRSEKTGQGRRSKWTKNKISSMPSRYLFRSKLLYTDLLTRFSVPLTSPVTLQKHKPSVFVQVLVLLNVS